MDHNYHVYIMANIVNTVLYTGVTNDLARRVAEHKLGIGSKFAKRYNLNKLVYWEHFTDVNAAIAREKQIKAGSRKSKVALIMKKNPGWIDLPL